jgi:glycosyltransferase involved in cell wall biosynthesis
MSTQLRARVCILRHAYYPNDPRVRKHVEALLEAGSAVDIICLRAENERGKERHGLLTIYRVPVRHKRRGIARYAFEYGAFTLMTFLLVGFLSVRHRYDIVQAYNMPDWLLWAGLPAKLRGTRLVWYMLELTPDLAADSLALSEQHALIRMLRMVEKICVRMADQIICVSTYQEAVISRRSLPVGKRVSVILNVPDAMHFRPGEFAPHTNSSYRLFTHGSILKRYRIDTAIRALPRLRQDIQEVELQVLGSGEHRVELEQLCRDLDVTGLVRFLDPVPYENVPSYIEQADVCLLLTGNPWLAPNKLFEYAAMRKPVIAARSDYLPTIFQKESVLSFEAGDVESFRQAVLTAYRDQAGSMERASRAHESFLGHRWEIEKEIYLQVLRDLIADGSRNAATN